MTISSEFWSRKTAESSSESGMRNIDKMDEVPFSAEASTTAMIAPPKTTSLKTGLLVRSDRPSQRKHRIAEGLLQIQPPTQAQTVVQLLKKMLDQGKAEAIDFADWL